MNRCDEQKMDFNYHGEIAKILKLIPKMKVTDLLMPTYVSNYTSVGGYMSLEEHFGIQAAMEYLLETRLELNLKTLKSVNRLINMFDNRGEEIYRPDDAPVFHPNCPKGIPLDILHLLHEDDAETCDHLEDLYSRNGNWSKIMDLIPIGSKEKMFKKVDNETHGSVKDFIKEWMEMDKMTPEDREIPPDEWGMMKGIYVHNIILRFMPFSRGNRRTARLALCHYFFASGRQPPIFLSRADYEFNAKFVSKKPEKHDLLLFSLYIFKMSVAGLYSNSNSNKIICYPEPWEQSILEGDLKNSVHRYVESRKRVTFNELVDIYETYMRVSGSEIIRDGEFWIARGLSSSFKESIMRCIEEGVLAFAETRKEEYMAYESGISYKDYDNWKPCVLVSETRG